MARDRDPDEQAPALRAPPQPLVGEALDQPAAGPLTPPRRLLVGDEAALADAYGAGATVEELAARHDCSVTTVRDVLRGAGVTLRPRGPRSPLEGREADVARDYLAGATVRALADRYDANQRTIRKVLAEAGVEMRPPGRRAAS